MPKLTTPSPADLILSQLNNKTAPTSLKDIVISRGNPTRKWELNSMMTQAARLLAEGGKYHHLVLEGVVRPSIRKSGTQPKWSINGGDPVPNVVPEPIWAASKEIAELSQTYQNLAIYDDQERKNLASLATAGKKAYLAATSLMMKVADKAVEEQILRQDTERRLEETEKQLEQRVIDAVLLRLKQDRNGDDRQAA